MLNDLTKRGKGSAIFKELIISNQERVIVNVEVIGSDQIPRTLQFGIMPNLSL